MDARDYILPATDKNNTPNPHGLTPLLEAILLQQHPKVRALVRTPGIDLEFRDQDGQTALTRAVRAQDVKVLQILLGEHDELATIANVNTQDDQGRTPLIWAIWSKYDSHKKYQVIDLLLKHGADVKIEDNDHRSASSYSRDSFVQLQLLPKGALRRRLVVCFDGTWNDREEKQPLTNVTRIHSCLEPTDRRYGSHFEQIPFYVDGIGTGMTMRGKYQTGATGGGIERKIREAYKFLCSTYTGSFDQIVLVGFSRGSYTAQCLAKLINDIGLISSDLINTHFPDIFDLWSKGDGFSPLKDFDPSYSEVEGDKGSLKGQCQRLLKNNQIRYPVYIHAYAVYDTVKSLGFPWPWKKEENSSVPGGRYAFVNELLPPNIHHAFHALALDEQRKNFLPLTLRVPNNPNQKLKQCWFLGSHSDIGGGNENNGLANISLCWMVSQLKQLVKFDQNACWGATATGSVLNIDMESTNRDIKGVQSVKSLTKRWRAGGKVTRVVRKSVPTSLDQTLRSHETIHFSVRALWSVARTGGVKSEPLQGYQFSETGAGGFKWVKTENGKEIVVPEALADFYEVGMMQRWLDRDAHFAETVKKAGAGGKAGDGRNRLFEHLYPEEVDDQPGSIQLEDYIKGPSGF